MAAGLNAQVSSYIFSQSAGTYTPITGGTVLGTPTNDDNIFAGNPIGFSFCFNGAQYTQFGVNANGWIYMGPSTGTSSYTSISSGSTNNVISAFNFDLQGEPTTGELRYQTIGSAPNRTLVVQFSNYDAYSSSTNTDTYNFQIRLSESTGQIDIVYGNFVCNSAIRTAQVGLRGASAADYNNLSVANGINTWATPAPGASNAATCEINNTPLVPSSGLTYTFSEPAAPVSPINLVFSGVTTTGMTLTWDDNSTNESTFFVYQSIDNINFTLVNTQASTSTATTGTQYNYTASGLYTNQIYYWRVLAGNANCGGTPLTGNQTTLSGTMCGTYTIGPTGSYPSLTAAIAAVQTNGVSCPLVFEFQAAYVSTVETFPIVVPFLGCGPTTSITARPELGATNLSITSNATQTIDFNNATYFSFDGRPGGVGSVSQLTIDNSSTTGNAVRFINDAQYCGLNYMKVRGVTTSATTGIVAFGNALTSGNSNDFITNSDLTSGATSAAVLVYGSNATANTTNANENLSNNVFYDWFGAAAADAAINVTGNSAGWSISNNSFYQTASRTYTSAVTHFAININTTTGTGTGNFVVSGNYIGGTAANCGGSAWTGTGAVAHRFIAVNVTTGSLGTNSVQGNTITNFNFTTTSGATTTNGIWCAINLTGTSANMNVGNVAPNMIGSTTTNGQIVTSTSTTGGMTVAINSSASGSINISGNMIGGITANSSSGTTSSSIYGILNSSGIPVISNNTIGSPSQANSLINAASTSATGGHITAISNSSGTGAVAINNNIIANLTNQYAGTSTTGQTRGIVNTSGVATISGNSITTLFNFAPQTGTGTSASVIGIVQSSTSTGEQSVTGNVIANLANGAATANVTVTGIIMSGPTTIFTNKVNRNNIQSLVSISSGTAIINGIVISGGIIRVYNNMVTLGLDPIGNAVVSPYEINGIYNTTTNRTSILFNSVLITGSNVASGTGNTYGYRCSVTTAAASDSIYNNVFANTRSNSTTGGIHYSISLNAASNTVLNGNVYFGNGTGYQTGHVATTDYASINTWMTAVPGQDLNSYQVNPNFQSNTNLHINNASPTALESRAIPVGNIVNDIDLNQRPGPVGSVNGGGTAPDIGADEFDGFPLSIDMSAILLVRPMTSGCHGSADSVVVRVKNISSQTIDFATNPCTVNAYTQGVNPQVFPPVSLTGTLAGLATMDVVVSTTYNMSATGTHTFRAYTSTTGDLVNSNDSMTAVNILISGGTAVASRPVICMGDSSMLSVSGYTNGGTIQWQSSPDNMTWSNVPGATTTSLNTGALSATTYYRAMICGTDSSVADTVTVNIVSAPTVNGDTRCGAGVVNLTATGSGTIFWYTQPTGGSSVATGTTYSPTVSTTTTFYAENFSGTPPSSQLTTLAAGNGSTGNMFSITALNTVTITNFDGHMPAGTANWEVWYRPNDYLLSAPASLNSNAGWTMLGAANNVVSNGTGVATPLPIFFNVTIPAGQTYSFYVTTTASTVNYTNGTTTGAVYAPGSNADFQFREGYGGSYFALANNPRIFNGIIHYYSGCGSGRVPVVATVNPAPAISAMAGSSTLCYGDSTQLVVSSSNTGYAYTWSPASGLSATTGDSVMASPSSPGYFTYYVDALDAGSGCAIRDSVLIHKGAQIIVTANVNSQTADTVCAGTSVNLDGTLPPSTIQVTNGNVLNTSTTYPSPYGNWFGGSRHQMLILASELTAAGMSAGYINGLQFQVTNTNASDPLANFEIDMAQTNVTSITTFQTLPFVTVYTNASYAPVVGFNTHTFSTPFYWDGVSNIIVQTCFVNLTSPTTTSYTYNCTMRQTATAFSSTVLNYADNTPTICTDASTTSYNQRPNIAFMMSYPYAYSWTPSVNVASPTSLSTTANPMVNTTYVLTVTDTTTGCMAMDSVMVRVNPNPAPNFGPDTAICSNTTLVLDGTAGNYSYLWQDNSTSQTYSVNAFGTYGVVVTDTITGCAGGDTILVGINSAPVFTLGSDATVCSGTQVTFSGPGGQYSYGWNTSDTTVSITTGTAGNYILVVTDTVNNCFSSDTVALAVNPAPAVFLGNDTSVCDGNGPLVLNAPSGNYSYSWSDASTNQTLPVTVTGNYYVIVTDNVTSCFSGDTILVNVNTSPAFTLGNDTTFCSGNGPIMLSGPAGPYNYMWSDASTGMTLSENTTGNYYLTVTDSVNGCMTSDTIALTVPMSPPAVLSDTMVCGSSVTLSGPSGSYNYSWSPTGDMTQTETINAPGGMYYLTTTDPSSGCATTDSSMVAINTPPTVTFAFGQASICTTDAPL
ncbi:MAG TPA: hypothetical protein VFU15_08705, partial [Bacteroidia bacterium]|nr:hypothetical protein [Bacteroidia bacterium]